MYFKIARLIFKVYFALFFRLKVHGLDNVPAEGASILCANHLSNYDVITLALALNRLPSYLAKSQLFENKLLGYVLLKLDAIPVNREKADMSVYRTVMDRLKCGKMVGIFAQGTRVKEGEAKDAKAGVALFATKSGAPVIPAAIVTDYSFFGRVDVVFGEPIDFSNFKGKKLSSKELSEISVDLMEKINTLIREYKK